MFRAWPTIAGRLIHGRNMDDEAKIIAEYFKIGDRLVSVLDGATGGKRFDLDTDHKRLIAVFLAKACKSHQGIMLLCRSGYGEDAAILNRSLLNLSINAYWIYQKAEQRVSAYLDYDHVLKARLNRKLVGSPALLGRSQNRLPEYKMKQVELDQRANEATQNHGYNRHGWSGKSLRDMAAEVGMTNDYDSGYTLISELEHTSVGSLDEYASLSPQGAFQVSGGPSTNWVHEAIGFAHLCLIKVAQLADRTLDLGISAELVAVDAETLRLSGAQRMSTTAQKE